MKIAQIVHNPTAGDKKHDKEELINLVEKAGYEVRYVSTDEEDWRNFYGNNIDIIFLAGGDGTIRKLAGVYLKLQAEQKQFPPIRLLPVGTANNIARTLQISQDLKTAVSETKGASRKFDCGKITGLENEDFFLEGVGFGIFPTLIAEMKKNKIEEEDPSEKLKKTLKVLLNIVKDFKAQKATINFDEITVKGSFLMVELMNIKYIGPNLELAPNVDPGDGYFDLVMIPENNRSELEEYLNKMIAGDHNNIDIQRFSKTTRLNKVEMNWAGSLVHVDDNLVNGYSEEMIEVGTMPNALPFIVEE